MTMNRLRTTQRVMKKGTASTLFMAKTLDVGISWEVHRAGSATRDQTTVSLCESRIACIHRY